MPRRTPRNNSRVQPVNVATSGQRASTSVTSETFAVTTSIRDVEANTTIVKQDDKQEKTGQKQKISTIEVPKVTPKPSRETSMETGAMCRICFNEGVCSECESGGVGGTSNKTKLRPCTSSLVRRGTRDKDRLIRPCKCLGSLEHVHQSCISAWVEHSGNNKCELCLTTFRKDTVTKWICSWSRLKMSSEESRLLACFVVMHTTMTICGIAVFALMAAYNFDSHYFPMWARILIIVGVASIFLIYLLAQIRYYINLFKRWHRQNRAVVVYPYDPKLDRANTSSTRQPASLVSTSRGGNQAVAEPINHANATSNGHTNAAMRMDSARSGDVTNDDDVFEYEDEENYYDHPVLEYGVIESPLTERSRRIQPEMVLRAASVVDDRTANAADDGQLDDVLADDERSLDHLPIVAVVDHSGVDSGVVVDDLESTNTTAESIGATSTVSSAETVIDGHTQMSASAAG